MSLQAAINHFGDPLTLLRAHDTDIRAHDAFAERRIFGYPYEWTNWRDEQRGYTTTAVLFNQTFHMEDVFISGPDTLKLLTDTAVNSFANFRPGIAKQYLAVTPEGYIIGDGIVVGLEENLVTIAAREWALNWLRFQAEKGGYDVKIETDLASGNGEYGTKRLYRYELEGPNASKIFSDASDGTFEHIKFFNTGKIKIAGHEVTLLNHTMGGVPGQEYNGFEFWGPIDEEQDVINAILAAGEKHGMIRGGASAYLAATIESGWMGACVVPGIYDSPELTEYREWLQPGIEFGSVAMAEGSFDPETVRGYYATPWDYGYGHVIKFDHDFIGREALEEMAKNPPRQKVWLTWNEEDVKRVIVESELGKPDAPKILPWPSNVGRDSVLIGDREVGVTCFHGYTENIGGWASLASIDTADVVEGAQVEILWGDRDGGASNPRVPNHKQTRIRASLSLKSPQA